MSGHYIVNRFYPNASTPRAELPAPSTIVAEEKEPSLAGRAGLLRENGTSYDDGAIPSAWAENLRYQYDLHFELPGPGYNKYNGDFKSIIFDEDTRNIIAATDLYAPSAIDSSMSYLPLSP